MDIVFMPIEYMNGFPFFYAERIYEWVRDQTPAVPLCTIAPYMTHPTLGCEKYNNTMKSFMKSYEMSVSNDHEYVPLVTTSRPFLVHDLSPGFSVCSFCVVFCRSLFVLLVFFGHCVFRLLRFKDFIAPLISSNIPFMEAIII